MKKNRCPPWSHGCELPNLHLDIAVPGYDNLQFSTSNVCGEPSRLNTFIMRSSSSICGSWFTLGTDTERGCDCSALPADTREQIALRRGCELFTAWGWHSGNPTLLYQPVECPAAFHDWISGAFDTKGTVALPTPVHPPTPQPPYAVQPPWAVLIIVLLVLTMLFVAILMCLLKRRGTNLCCWPLLLASVGIQRRQVGSMAQQVEVVEESTV